MRTAHRHRTALLAPLAALCVAASAQTIVELQASRQGATVALAASAGGPASASLIALNPAVNTWFLLTLADAGQAASTTYHLENADPKHQRMRLDAGAGGSLLLTVDGRTTTCALWSGPLPTALERARRAGLPFAPLCDARLYLRNPVRGKRTYLEATTEFLRDHVWGGEKIIGFVRNEFFRDAFVQRGAAAASAAPAAAGSADAPPPALLRDGDAARRVVPEGLGIDLGASQRTLVLGQWAAVPGLPGVHLSAIDAAALPAVPAAPGVRPWQPDAVEAGALAYLVAFDLARFDLGFALGTEHPRIGWSERVRDDMRDPALPGPDGIASAAPLVRSGMLSPWLQARAVATFTGGFKREHGAFRYGALALRQHGSHYGFVEQGIVFSRLVPGLATLFVLDDGAVGMKTWTDTDAALLPRLRDARQNGVPLLEPDPRSGVAVSGALVDQWGAGNWSGSPEERLRTLRAGACLVEGGAQRHLVYGYFSTATPATMAQVFRAYGCRYAMHLDMNALEHTYLALYVRQGSRMAVEHLVQDMAQLDAQSGGKLVPRFLGMPDDRDFFYLLRKQAGR